ncbi:MAG TPA: hypothetical protein VLJ11_08535 [Bryobacteraceae bacterium]|nr:hypothetical protein [Bryobacteraceae bacterium]
MKEIKLTVLLMLVVAQSQGRPVEAKAATPDLDVIVQNMERVQQQNPARSRAYEVTREYKEFRADNKQPTAKIVAQISYNPHDKNTFKIVQASGNAWGEKIVRNLLEQEAEPAKAGHGKEISRANYDFAFLRQENFGLHPEYVLHIVPKRREKNLLWGEIWVDAMTFRIRRIEGVPAKSPSIWIKDAYITLRFAEVNQMWIPVSLDSIATVRLLGRYTLAAHYVGPPDTVSITPTR